MKTTDRLDLKVYLQASEVAITAFDPVPLLLKPRYPGNTMFCRGTSPARKNASTSLWKVQQGGDSVLVAQWIAHISERLSRLTPE